MKIVQQPSVRLFLSVQMSRVLIEHVTAYVKGRSIGGSWIGLAG